MKGGVYRMLTFQLSFAAVTAILLLQPGLYGLLPVKNTALRKVWALITVSIAAQIGTAPLVMLYFSRFSTHFLLTNLWVIPLVSLIVYATVVLLALTPFPGLQHFFAEMTEMLIRLQNTVLRWIEQLPLASIDHIRMDIREVFPIIRIRLWRMLPVAALSSIMSGGVLRYIV